jgi:hypothetical protein
MFANLGRHNNLHFILRCFEFLACVNFISLPHNLFEFQQKDQQNGHFHAEGWHELMSPVDEFDATMVFE